MSLIETFGENINDVYHLSKKDWVSKIRIYIEVINWYVKSEDKLRETKNMLIFMSSDMYWIKNFSSVTFLHTVKMKLISFLEEDITENDKIFFRQKLYEFGMVKYCKAYTKKGYMCKKNIKKDDNRILCKMHENEKNKINKELLDSTCLYEVLTSVIVEFVLYKE